MGGILRTSHKRVEQIGRGDAEGEATSGSKEPRRVCFPGASTTGVGVAQGFVWKRPLASATEKGCTTGTAAPTISVTCCVPSVSDPNVSRLIHGDGASVLEERRRLLISPEDDAVVREARASCRDLADGTQSVAGIEAVVRGPDIQGTVGSDGVWTVQTGGVGCGWEPGCRGIGGSGAGEQVKDVRGSLHGDVDAVSADTGVRGDSIGGRWCRELDG